MGISESIASDPNSDHLLIESDRLCAFPRESERTNESIPKEDGLLLGLLEDAAGLVEAVELGIHVDELGGEEGVLVEPIVDEVLVDGCSVGERAVVGAGEEEEFVGLLGGIGFLGEEMEGLFEMALLGEMLNLGVFGGLE